MTKEELRAVFSHVISVPWEVDFQSSSGHMESSQGQWCQWVFSDEYRNMRVEESSRVTVLCCHILCTTEYFSGTSRAPSKSYVKSFAFPIKRLYQNFPPLMFGSLPLNSHYTDFRGIIGYPLGYPLQRGCAPAAFMDGISDGLVPKAEKIKSKSHHVLYQ